MILLVHSPPSSSLSLSLTSSSYSERPANWLVKKGRRRMLLKILSPKNWDPEISDQITAIGASLQAHTTNKMTRLGATAHLHFRCHCPRTFHWRSTLFQLRLAGTSQFSCQKSHFMESFFFLSAVFIFVLSRYTPESIWKPYELSTYQIDRFLFKYFLCVVTRSRMRPA